MLYVVGGGVFAFVLNIENASTKFVIEGLMIVCRNIVLIGGVIFVIFVLIFVDVNFLWGV